jgi:hypothetical protein
VARRSEPEPRRLRSRPSAEWAARCGPRGCSREPRGPSPRGTRAGLGPRRRARAARASSHRVAGWDRGSSAGGRPRRSRN